ncbi:ROK family transcriptional regulator [Tessaracoccus sp. Z1128]
METHRSARAQHRTAVLGVLNRGYQLTRSELARELGITRTAISEALTELRDEGAIVVVSSREVDGRGRRAEVLSVHPGAVRFVGIDYSHSRVLVCLANASGEIVAKGVAACGSADGWEKRCQTGIGLVRELGEGEDIHLDFLSSIAIGLPGPNAAAWASGDRSGDPTEPFRLVRARIREVFAADFGVPVQVDHHIRYAAQSEAASDGDSKDNLIYLRLSAGVGGAVLCEGRVPAGAHKLAGEIGHAIIDRSSSAAVCRCGRSGCLETVASSEALVRSWRALGHAAATLADLAEAVDSGDVQAHALVGGVAEDVGRVLGLAALVTDPEEVVIAGEAGALLMEFAPRLQAALDREVLPSQQVAVRRARLGDEAGALGAVVALMPDHHPQRLTYRTKEFV